jgi:hypothetical protein
VVITAVAAEKKTPVAADYDFTGLSAIEDGLPKRVGIVPKASGDRSNGVITIKYGGSLVEPISKGSYIVTFDVAETDTWNAAAGLDGGTLVIEDQTEGAARPVREDFDVYGLGEFAYDGKALYNVSVTPKDDTKSRGLVTVRYNGDASVLGVSAPNTYTVTFDVAASAGWLSASGLVAGILKINDGEDSVASFFDMSGFSQVYEGNIPRAVKITPKYGYTALQAVNITYTGIGETKYGPSASAPSVAGQFTVEFDVWAAAGSGFKNAYGLPAGTLTIGDQGTPVAYRRGDFAVDDDTSGPPWNSSYDVREKIVISVNPAASKKGDVGVITVYYQNTKGGSVVTDSPVSAGQYNVSFSVGASVGNVATAENFSLGTLTIRQADAITVRDVVMTGVNENRTYDGNPKSVGISIPKLTTDEVVPVVNVKYNLSSTPPTNADTYTVTFDLAEDTYGNWLAQSGIYAGELIIKKGDPNRSDFDVSPLADKTFTYGDAGISGFTVTGKTDLTVSDGKIGYIYRKAGAPDLTTVPEDAGTYEVSVKILESDNWTEREMKLTQKLIIDKRDPVKSDFKPTANSDLFQYLYSVREVAFEADPARVPRYPAAPPRPTYVASDGRGYAVTAINTRVAQTYKATLRLPSRDNWNAKDLEWDLVIQDIVFDDVNAFVKWYGERPVRPQPYSATFKPGIISTPTLLKVITDALKDEGPEDPDTAKYNNKDKLISLDFSNGSIAVGGAGATFLTGAGNGFSGCANLTGLNLKSTGVLAIDANTLAGCSNLIDLKLPDSLTGGPPVALPARAFNDLVALKTVDLGSVTSVGTNSFKSLNAAGDVIGNIAITELTVMGIGVSGYTAAPPPGTLSAFDGMSSLKVLNVLGDGSNTGISTYAFRGSGLTTVNLPAAFGSSPIAANAFQNCGLLANVKFPVDTLEANGTVTPGGWTGTIAADAFSGCNALRNVVIPVQGGTINADAFGGATSYVTNLTMAGPATGTAAFKGNRRLETVTLLTGVTTVAETAFQDCSNILTVTFPNTGMLGILDNAFNGCSRLTNITLPTNTEFVTIGTYAFKDCKNITSVTLPAGLKDTTAGTPLDIVAEGAFQNSGLTSVTIPGASGGSIVGVGIKAFAGCTDLERVVLPDNTSFAFIGANAFDGCSKLKTVTNNAAVAATAAGASSGTVEEGVVLIPSGVFVAYVATTPVGFGTAAFNGCTSIASLKLNVVAGSVRADLGNAFNGCTKLETITLTGAGLTTGAGSITVIPGPALAPTTIPSVKYLVLDIESIDGANFTGLTGLEELIVRASYTTAKSIGAGVFLAANNTKFTTLRLTKANQGTTLVTDLPFASLPTTVKNVIIGDEEPASGTTPVGINLSTGAGGAMFPIGVNYVEFTSAIGALTGSGLFSNLGTTAATRITVSINSAPGTKLAGGVAIGTVILGKDTPLIGTTSFTSTSLKEFRVANDNKFMGSWAGDGVLYGKDTTPGSKTYGSLTTLIQYPILKDAEAYGAGNTVPGTLRELGDGSFGTNAALKFVTIPSTIEKIGNIDFATGLTAVETVAYNAVLAAVDASATAFTGGSVADVVDPISGVVTRRGVTIGEGVKYVPKLFAAITGITEITIPSSVTDIEASAFVVGNSGLKIVEFNADALTTTAAFSGVTSIETIRIGPNVTAIPASTFASTGVRVIRLPGVITIGASAFNLCNRLSTVTIGSRCESIGASAFVQAASATGNYNLTTVEIESNGIISLTGAFNAASATAGDLVNLYGSSKAGIYSWETDGTTTFSWKYVKF